MAGIRKINGLTVPHTLPLTSGTTSYSESSTTHSESTIPTWTTRHTHTLSAGTAAYITDWYNSGTGTSYTQSFHFRLLVNSVEIYNSYTDIGSVTGRCWPEPYTSNDNWTIIGAEADTFTKFIQPFWCGKTIAFQSSPTTASTTHYLNWEIRVVDVTFG